MDCTADISSVFCRRGHLQASLLRRGLRGKIGFGSSGSRIRTPLASDEEVGYMGCVCAWGGHALASNLEAGCTSKCMHFPQITRLACLLVLVLVTIEVQHRFGYLLILISPTVTFSKAVFNPDTSEILI